NASRPDWAVTIDEMQACPHRGASRAQSLAYRLRLICDTIGQLRPRVDAEIKASRIEWRGFKQLLRKVVSRHTAVRRDAEICRKQRRKRDNHRHPVTNSGIGKKKSKRNQSAGSPKKIQTKGNALFPPVWKIEIAMAVKITKASAAVASVADHGLRESWKDRSASAAQTARTK